MTESLSESQERVAKNGSKEFERSWRVVSHPSDYSLEEVKQAHDYIVQRTSNFAYLLNSDSPIVDPEVIKKVYLGIYHYKNYNEPVELKYHPNAN